MKQNWQQLTAVQFSLTVGLPAIMVGYVLISKYGFLSALIGVFGGSLILFVTGLISATLALSKKLTTIEYAKLFFGPKGTLICSMSMGVSLCSMC